MASNALLGVGHHAVDLLLAETALVVLRSQTVRNPPPTHGDRDLLALARALVGGRDLHDAWRSAEPAQRKRTVGVNLERDLDLRHASRRRRDAGELELAKLRMSIEQKSSVDARGCCPWSSHARPRRPESGPWAGCRPRSRRSETSWSAARVRAVRYGQRRTTTVLRWMSLVKTPPVVSIPRVSGQTSIRTMPLRPSSPLRMPAWMAAPYATASSGLMPLDGSLPLKKSFRRAWTRGMRVEPPTRTMSSTFCRISQGSSQRRYAPPSSGWRP